MQVHYYLRTYINSVMHQHRQSSLKTGLQNVKKDDLTFPEWRALIENQGDTTLIH